MTAGFLQSLQRTTGQPRAYGAGLLLLLALLMPPLPVFADGVPPSEIRALVKEGRILSFEQVRARINTKYPGRIQEVELEEDDGRYVYEMQILDSRSGIVWKLEVDAASGELLEAKRRH